MDPPTYRRFLIDLSACGLQSGEKIHDRDGQQFARVRIFTLSLLSFGPIYTAVYLLLGAPISATIVCTSVLVLIVNLMLLRSPNNVCLCGWITTAASWSCFTALACVNGGHNSPSTAWFTTVPVFATVMLGIRSGIRWGIVSGLAVLALYAVKINGWSVPNELDADAMRFLEMTGLLGVMTCIFLLTTTFRNLENAAHRAIATSLESATQASQAKSEFLANMSHEIRTPLTAILGNSEILAEGELDHDESLELLGVVNRNGKHLLQIVDDILDLSKIEAGRITIEPRAFSPVTLVKDVVSQMGAQADSKGLPVRVVEEKDVPAQLMSDPTRLRQILINLLGNALKFTHEGEIQVHVSCEHTNDAVQLRFDVVDTGIGMKAEQLDRLFQPFLQADNSTTRLYGGTGLGLTISRRLAQLLGGSLTASSAEGLGSTFTVTVATQVARPETHGDSKCRDKQTATSLTLASPALTSDSVASANQDTPSTIPYSILVAEDGLDNQRLITYILRKAGAEVTVVENGQLAVEAAWSNERPFDVVLMDMQMPVLDGYQATQQLRQAGYEHPIIALTAHTMEGQRDRCIEAGCNDYTTKPLKRQELLELIHRYAGCKSGPVVSSR